jgi:hypothetical protein
VGPCFILHWAFFAVQNRKLHLTKEATIQCRLARSHLISSHWGFSHWRQTYIQTLLEVLEFWWKSCAN